MWYFFKETFLIPSVKLSTWLQNCIQTSFSDLGPAEDTALHFLENWFGWAGSYLPDPALCGIFCCSAQASLVGHIPLVPWPGIKPTSPALEGWFLATRPPGKSQDWIAFWNFQHFALTHTSLHTWTLKEKKVPALIMKNSILMRSN